MVRVNWNLKHLTNGGYAVLLLLSAAWGHDGLILYLPVVKVEITWGEAARKNKEIELNNSTK